MFKYAFQLELSIPYVVYHLLSKLPSLFDAKRYNNLCIFSKASLIMHFNIIIPALLSILLLHLTHLLTWQ